MKTPRNIETDNSIQFQDRRKRFKSNYHGTKNKSSSGFKSKSNLRSKVVKKYTSSEKNEQIIGAFNRIGAKDAFISDMSFGVKTDWKGIYPNILLQRNETTINNKINENKNKNRNENGNIISLKTIAVNKLTPYVDRLTIDYLKSCPFTGIWSNVWINVLNSGYDSFNVFCKFASQFYKNDSFQCHKNINNSILSSTNNPYRNNNESLRDNYLFKNLTPNKKRHRIEMIPNNEIIDIKSLIETFQTININYLNFNNLLLIDLGNIKNLTHDNLISLMNFENLIGLDVSNIGESFNDTILTMWNFCLKQGKWPKLQILLLGSNKLISKQLIKKFLISSSSILYLECDENLDMKDNKSLESFTSHGWETLQPNIQKRFIKTGYNLSKKYYIIRNLTDNKKHITNEQHDNIKTNRVTIGRHILFDICFSSKSEPFQWDHNPIRNLPVFCYIRFKNPDIIANHNHHNNNSTLNKQENNQVKLRVKPKGINKYRFKLT